MGTLVGLLFVFARDESRVQHMSSRTGAILGAAVPDAAVEDCYRACRRRQVDFIGMRCRTVVHQLADESRVEVAFRDQSRGAVVGGHVVEQPQGVDHVVDPVIAGSTPIGVQDLLPVPG